MDKNFLKLAKQLSVLFVEDDRFIRSVYKMGFSEIFGRIYLAGDGKEGLHFFHEYAIDIVVTDYSMPHMDGLQMSRIIRQHDLAIPIILVSAFDDAKMLKEALSIPVTSFLQKPFSYESIMQTLSIPIKSVVADRLLIEKQKEVLEYSRYQQRLTYQKERLIAKNDLRENHGKILFFHYRLRYMPKDVLSGDSFSIRQLSKDRYLLFIVDAMGKGTAASVSAMLATAFLNYEIDRLLRVGRIELTKLLNRLIIFMRPNLLEDETLSGVFILLDGEQKNLEYANFAMPAVLIEQEKKIVKLRANNLPICAYSHDLKTDTYPIEQIKKILLYSDGLNEIYLKQEELAYTKDLIEDFLASEDERSFWQRWRKRLRRFEDDLTYLFLWHNTV